MIFHVPKSVLQICEGGLRYFVEKVLPLQYRQKDCCMNAEEIKILEMAGIKPTSNRILVVRALVEASSPMSLIELETLLETLERSSILRVLTVLSEHGLVHVMEDGRGVSKYELCHSHDHSEKDDHHAHFYCEKCHRVYCFEDVTVPRIPVPDGFEIKGVNFMLKGICPSCKAH